MDKTYKKMDNITNSPTPFQSELQAFKHSFLTNLSNYIIIENIVDPENKRKRGCIINQIDRPWCCVTYELNLADNIYTKGGVTHFLHKYNLIY